MGRVITDGILYSNKMISSEFALEMLNADVDFAQTLPDIFGDNEQRAIDWATTLYDWFWGKAGFDKALFTPRGKNEVSTEAALSRGLRVEQPFWEE